MAHRDDREAERARIEALEQQLRDAEARAEQAEREARAAGERARASEARAASATAKAKEKEQRARDESAALRKRERKAKRADTAPASASTPRGWAHEARRRYRIASAAAAAASYAAVALAQLLASSAELDRRALLAVPIAAAADVALHFVVGKATHAPDPFAGAWITLIAGALSIGGVLLLASGALFEDVLPAGLVPAARVIGALVAIGVGAALTSAWSTDAASLPG